MSQDFVWSLEGPLSLSPWEWEALIMNNSKTRNPRLAGRRGAINVS